MTELFACPLCGGGLTRQAGSLRCPAGHCFDVAREGYTYLLPVNRRHSKSPGDDKAMAAARSAFLSKGWYAPLRDALCKLSVSLTGDAPAVLDTGCGEGYYTAGVYRALLDAGKVPTVAGTDISKPILRLAAKREKNIQFAVASSYHLPVADTSIDLLLNCFSPFAQEEFSRVLRPGGRMIYVVPGAEHLYQMKAVLYEKPYKNPVQQVEYPGFRAIDEREVQGTITVPAAQLEALFAMTPYYWKTPKSGCQRLAALEELAVTISFDIHVFRREA